MMALRKMCRRDKMGSASLPYTPTTFPWYLVLPSSSLWLPTELQGGKP